MTRLSAALLAAVLAGAGAFGPARAAEPKFVGHVVARWDDDGRGMVLVEPFTFVDAAGAVWTAPAGARVGGASIPQVAWSFLGGPFDGKYRRASVLHDWYCEARTRPAEQVHRMFYAAMRAAGEDEDNAKLLYAAVVRFGPNWEGEAAEAATPLGGEARGRSPADGRSADAAMQGGSRPEMTEAEAAVVYRFTAADRQAAERIYQAIKPRRPYISQAEDIDELQSTILRDKPDLDRIDSLVVAQKLLDAVAADPSAATAAATDPKGSSLGDPLREFLSGLAAPRARGTASLK